MVHDCYQISQNLTLLKTNLCFLSLLHRPYWRCYYSNTDAIIYVVDSADRDRIGISKQELVSMLEVSWMEDVYR